MHTQLEVDLNEQLEKHGIVVEQVLLRSITLPVRLRISEIEDDHNNSLLCSLRVSPPHNRLQSIVCDEEQPLLRLVWCHANPAASKPKLLVCMAECTQALHRGEAKERTGVAAHGVHPHQRWDTSARLPAQQCMVVDMWWCCCGPANHVRMLFKCKHGGFHHAANSHSQPTVSSIMQRHKRHSANALRRRVLQTSSRLCQRSFLCFGLLHSFVNPVQMRHSRCAAGCCVYRHICGTFALSACIW